MAMISPTTSVGMLIVSIISLAVDMLEFIITLSDLALSLIEMGNRPRVPLALEVWIPVVVFASDHAAGLLALHPLLVLSAAYLLWPTQETAKKGWGRERAKLGILFLLGVVPLGYYTIVLVNGALEGSNCVNWFILLLASTVLSPFTVWFVDKRLRAKFKSVKLDPFWLPLAGLVAHFVASIMVTVVIKAYFLGLGQAIDSTPNTFPHSALCCLVLILFASTDYGLRRRFLLNDGNNDH